MNKTSERNYGVDLLKILSMFSICLLHTLKQGCALEASSGTYNMIYNFLFILTCTAVDCFAIISGYFAIDANHRYVKIIKMWFQVFFYSFGIPLGINILRLIVSSPEGFEVSQVLSGLLPVLNGKYWYFNAYFILFFFMPFINKALLNLGKETAKKALIVFSCLLIAMYVFVASPSCNFLGEGRSVYWITLMYILGALIKKSELLINAKTSTIVVLYSISILTSFIYYYSNHVTGPENIFPLFWISSVLLVKIFERLKPNTKIVSFLSPLCFGTYLLHTHFYFRYYFLSERFIDYTYINTINGVIVVFLTSVFVFFVGIVIDYLRTVIFKVLKIDKLSERILHAIQLLINKLSCII